jgi:4-hydroxybenzoate polyprenyltransferase
MNRIKPYLQLVRLPNLFTAAADSLAGWLIVRGSLESPERWLPLVLASVAIYAAGIVLNDVFDYEIDLRERPKRPLPSGRVSRRFAAWLGGIALAMGPVLAGLSGSMSSLVVALALASCVLAYDAGLKRTVLGPEAMGACRGLNLLLGLSQGPEMGGPAAWLVATGLGLFIVGVTWISRSEVETGKTRGLVAGLVLQGVALIVLIVACSRPGWFRSMDSATPIVGSSAFGLIVLLAVGSLAGRAGFHAYRRPVPETFQRAVKTGVLSLVWLDVAAVAAVRGPATALWVAALWVPAFLLGKWLYST